jgi:menaquinone-dependent protoporphyrinogen IX oxidase
MKTLIAYYSRTGHNEQLAKQLHEQMPSDLDPIVDTKNREGMFGCVISAIFKQKTQIRFTKDPQAYDQVIVVTPLWGGSLPPATRTYLTQNRAKLNQFALLSVCGRGEENKNALADVAATAQKKPIASLLLKEVEVGSDMADRKVVAFTHQLPQQVLT